MKKQNVLMFMMGALLMVGDANGAERAKSIRDKAEINPAAPSMTHPCPPSIKIMSVTVGQDGWIPYRGESCLGEVNISQLMHVNQDLVNSVMRLSCAYGTGRNSIYMPIPSEKTCVVHVSKKGYVCY